jgi:hypothetical protein
MTEQASAWYPVLDITDVFGSISVSYEPRATSGAMSRSALVALHGRRDLRLKFSGVIALYCEDDCPGNFPIPSDRPRLNADYMFPLLKIENSRWGAQWPMWPQAVHYALISLDDIVHVLAQSSVEAKWGNGHAA